MTDFIKSLEIKKMETNRRIVNHYVDNIVDNYVRIFKPIRLGPNLFLSIQASYGHYCRPAITTNDLNTYTHWEVALFDDENFLRVSDIAPDLPCAAEMDYYFDNSVYGNVPTDLVEDLYNGLIRL
jgi:hypothetical protein